MTAPSELKASEQVLRLPEVLSNIFERMLDEDFWIAYDDDEDDDDESDMGSQPLKPLRKTGFGPYGSLLRCALVCRRWSEEAIPSLWSHYASEGYGDNLSSLFENITPSRKQYFANLIVEATQRFETDAYDVFSGVSFPNLTHIKFYVSGGVCGEGVASIKAPNLTHLNIDPHYESAYPETYGVSPSEWPGILDTFANMFPSVEFVEFDDPAMMEPSTLEEFKAKLPKLKVYGGPIVNTQ